MSSPTPPCRFDLGDSAPQVSGVKVYQSASSGADEVIMELDFGWTSDAEMSMVVHPVPHSAWLATPVVEILSKLIVVKVGSAMDHVKKMCTVADSWPAAEGLNVSTAFSPCI